jgi:hypothetical protein
MERRFHNRAQEVIENAPNDPLLSRRARRLAAKRQQKKGKGYTKSNKKRGG